MKKKGFIRDQVLFSYDRPLKPLFLFKGYVNMDCNYIEIPRKDKDKWWNDNDPYSELDKELIIELEWIVIR